MLNLEGKTWVAYIPLGHWTKGKGHRVCFVIKNEAGYHPSGDTPEGGQTEPWYWGNGDKEGTSYKSACEMADKYNSELGIYPEQAKEIVDSSIIASIRQQGLGKKRRSA